LFVDDDPVLRKLFIRTAKTVAPGWSFREASNGETALRLVETESFDLIFMDMYMASVEKQLLGTETVVALRKKGVHCRICGLSANDKESEFLEAGADVFTFKPFPCEPRTLAKELYRVLYSNAGHRPSEKPA
jgi:CheY-like chemotaxis protein